MRAKPECEKRSVHICCGGCFNVSLISRLETDICAEVERCHWSCVILVPMKKFDALVIIRSDKHVIGADRNGGGGVAGPYRCEYRPGRNSWKPTGMPVMP